MEGRGYGCVHAWVDPHIDSVGGGPSHFSRANFCSSPFANGATFLGFEMASRFLNKY